MHNQKHDSNDVSEKPSIPTVFVNVNVFRHLSEAAVSSICSLTHNRVNKCWF